jgi:hypothetical protein
MPAVMAFLVISHFLYVVGRMLLSNMLSSIILYTVAWYCTTKVENSLQLLAYAGSSLADSPTLKMEVTRSSETSIHGAASQKTAFFIVTAMKTSNLTY